MEFIINRQSLPFSIYVTPFYLKNQPDNEINFFVELQNGVSFCCKLLTLEKSWVVTVNENFPEDLIEVVYKVIGEADPMEVLGEMLDVTEF